MVNEEEEYENEDVSEDDLEELEENLDEEKPTKKTTNVKQTAKGPQRLQEPRNPERFSPFYQPEKTGLKDNLTGAEITDVWTVLADIRNILEEIRGGM